MLQFCNRAFSVFALLGILAVSAPEVAKPILVEFGVVPEHSETRWACEVLADLEEREKKLDFDRLLVSLGLSEKSLEMEILEDRKRSLMLECIKEGGMT